MFNKESGSLSFRIFYMDACRDIDFCGEGESEGRKENRNNMNLKKKKTKKVGFISWCSIFKLASLEHILAVVL